MKTRDKTPQREIETLDLGDGWSGALVQPNLVAVYLEGDFVGHASNWSEAQDKADRLREKYAGGVAAVMQDASTTAFSKGGPWRYTYTDEEDKEVVGTISLGTKAEAQKELRRQLGRKRLPNGIEWEVAR